MSDLRVAFRQMVKNPGFTAVVVVTLALGIGANTAIFSVVNAVLLRPLPFPGQDRLVTLWESNPVEGLEQQRVSPPNFDDWRAQSRSFEGMANWTGPSDHNLVTSAGWEKVRTSYGSTGLFSLLRVEPQLGRGFLPEEDAKEGPQTAVISDRLWQRHFGGDPQVLGRSLTVDTYGRRTYTIVGVMPAGFQFPEDTELWLAAGWNGLPRDRRSGHWLNVLARLRPSVTAAQAQRELEGIQLQIAQASPGTRPSTGISVVPLLRQVVGRDLGTALWVLWGVVAGVLLIACANVANLLLARAASRQREIAVKLALGAGRRRLIRELLVESLLLAVLGGALGALLGYGGVHAFLATSPANIPRLAEVTVNGTVLGFTLLAALLTGLVFGLAPAWQCTRPDLGDALKDGSRTASGGISAVRTRSSLVIVEVALATVLLIGAGLMLQSFAKLLATDRGFQAEQVLTVELDFSVSGFSSWVRPEATRPQVGLRELLENLRRLPGVHAAGASYQFLRRDNRPPVNWPFTIHGRPVFTESDRPTAEHNAITPGFFSALGVPLLSGRDVTEFDSLDAPGTAWVNESFVRRYFPEGNVLGQHIALGASPGPLGSRDRWGVPNWCEIVGVVGDVKSLSAQPEAAPEIYRSYWQWPMQNPTLYVRASGDAWALAEAVRRETARAIPNLPPPRIRPMTERLAESVAQPRLQAGLLGSFAVVALLLAAIGIHGVLAYSVSQRERELGVRMALGAQRSDVVSLIMGHGAKLVLAGMAFGVVGAVALTRVLKSQLYHVTPTDPFTFLFVALLLFVVALLASWLPARRAARSDPMSALRSE